MSSSSYTPDEPYSTIIREQLWLQGTFLSNFFFGVQITVGVLAFLAVLRRRTANHSYTRIALLLFIAVVIALTTAEQGLMLKWIQMGFITERNYPGGPDAFLRDEQSIPVNVASNILAVVANWMMESLLVWRCHVVCSTGERLWWYSVSIPLFLLIAVFVTGSLFIHQIIHISTPSVTFLAYGIASLTLNLIATGFIAGRLLVHRHHIVSQLGRIHGNYYVSITMVVVESAAVYTGFLVIVIVAYAVENSATDLLLLVLVQVQTIASFFIIWRIARGEAWTSSTDTAVASAAVSSLNARVVQPPQPSMIQLEILSTRRVEVEGVNVQPTENESTSKFSFHKGGEV